MTNWIKEYKWWIALSVVLTIEAVKYEYERRGSLEFGSEYLLILLPIVVYLIKAIWWDSKQMLQEELTAGWVER